MAEAYNYTCMYRLFCFAATLLESPCGFESVGLPNVAYRLIKYGVDYQPTVMGNISFTAYILIGLLEGRSNLKEDINTQQTGLSIGRSVAY